MAHGSGRSSKTGPRGPLPFHELPISANDSEFESDAGVSEINDDDDDSEEVSAVGHQSRDMPSDVTGMLSSCSNPLWKWLVVVALSCTSLVAVLVFAPTESAPPPRVPLPPPSVEDIRAAVLVTAAPQQTGPSNEAKFPPPSPIPPEPSPPPPPPPPPTPAPPPLPSSPPPHPPTRPPPRPPMPPWPPQHSSAALLSERFRAGRPTPSLAEAGVLLHQFDDYEDASEPWKPGKGNQAANAGDRMSCSLVLKAAKAFSDRIPIFSTRGGVVLQPSANRLLCACTCACTCSNPRARRRSASAYPRPYPRAYPRSSPPPRLWRATLLPRYSHHQHSCPCSLRPYFDPVCRVALCPTTKPHI